MSSFQSNSRFHQEKRHQIIRVNQAGEYGAVQIYKGQLQVTKDPEVRSILETMLEQEKNHLQRFDEQIIKNRVHPTIFEPLWHVAGFTLGAVTGLMGKKAVMACTTAVEEVIDTHYKSQEEYLEKHVYGEPTKEDQELKSLITQCRQEELEHRDIGYAHGAKEAIGYPLLSNSIKIASKIAIWLSKRF